MKTASRIALFTALFTQWPSCAVQAAEYRQMLPAQSQVLFSYQQMGVRMDGRFTQFSAQLSFDPAKPQAAKAALDIPLGSIDAGSAEANQEVAGKAWFNTAAFPTARFISQQVKALGGNRYELTGSLSIKGKAQTVVIPVTVTPQGKQAVFDGQFTIRRADFAIGEGSWAKFDIVANDVAVQFHLTASGQ